jgi:hypothetical protein
MIHTCKSINLKSFQANMHKYLPSEGELLTITKHNQPAFTMMAYSNSVGGDININNTSVIETNKFTGSTEVKK